MSMSKRLVFAAACLLAGMWAFEFHPPISYRSEAFPLFYSCIGCYMTGSILFVLGDSLARIETWMLRRAFPSIPEPTGTEVATLHGFGLMLVVCGVLIPPCL